jgi:transmembrane sensor
MTDRIDENPPMMSIPEQAAEWLLRWQGGDVNVAERYEYLQWLKTSPVHIAEMLRICRLHSWLKDAKLSLYVTNEDTFSNVVPLASQKRERESAKAREAGSASLWRTRFAAGVAVIGLGAVLSIAAKIVWFDHTLQTQASEWRSVPLSDGSSITAAPFTRLRHDIGDDQRFISLNQGKAVFRVAKDPSRPFLVEAGGIVIRATGTQFAVETGDENVTVTMREGTVVVTPAANSEAKFETLSLKVDDQLTVSGSGAPRLARVNSEREIDWVHVYLSEGDTIGDAVEKFNEYNEIKIVVDEQTSGRQMRGRFDAIDPLSFADTVGRAAQAAVVRESPELIRIKQPGRHR